MLNVLFGRGQLLFQCASFLSQRNDICAGDGGLSGRVVIDAFRITAFTGGTSRDAGVASGFPLHGRLVSHNQLGGIGWRKSDLNLGVWEISFANGQIASYLSTPRAGCQSVRDATVGRVERGRLRRGQAGRGIRALAHGFAMVDQAPPKDEGKCWREGSHMRGGVDYTRGSDRSTNADAARPVDIVFPFLFYPSSRVGGSWLSSTVICKGGVTQIRQSCHITDIPSSREGGSLGPDLKCWQASGAGGGNKFKFWNPGGLWILVAS